MSNAMIVPSDLALGALPIEVTHEGDPWIVSVKAVAGDGSFVKLAWDEVACSTTVWWCSGDHELVRMERETVSRIFARGLDEDRVELRIESESEGLTGTLVVRIHDGVTISDALLRT